MKTPIAYIGADLSAPLVRLFELRAIAMFLILAVSSAVSAQTNQISLASALELRNTEVLVLGGGCDYWDISDPHLTMYQIARLGFADVRSFQHAQGLKTDGVIGPKTRNKVRDLYGQTFPSESTPVGILTNLSLTLHSAISNGQTRVHAAIINAGSSPVRFLGLLSQDKMGTFGLYDIPLTIRRGIGRRKGDLIACGESRHDGGTIKRGTILQAGSRIVYGATSSSLAQNEDGAWSIEFLLFDQTQSVTNLYLIVGERPISLTRGNKGGRSNTTSDGIRQPAGGPPKPSM